MPTTPNSLHHAAHRLLLAVVTAVVLAITPVAVAAPPAPVPDVLETLNTGVINWSTGTIQAVGVSSPMAVSGAADGAQERIHTDAKADAQKRLILTARHVRIQTGLTIGDVLDRQPRLAGEFRVLVQNLPVAGQQYLSDGTLKITLTLPLFGGPAQLFLPEEIRQVQPIKAIAAPVPQKQAAPKAAAPAPKAPPYTGWLLDARGTGARTAMAIAVRDEGGRTIYGAAYVSREFVVHAGMSGYTIRRDPEASVARVGARPMVTKVLRAVGDTRNDLVISNADAAALRSDVTHLSFLRECRVMIILDPPAH